MKGKLGDKVVIRGMSLIIRGTDSDAKRAIKGLVRWNKKTEDAFKDGRMERAAYDNVRMWIVQQKNIHVRAMRLVTQNGYTVEYVSECLHLVPTLYALAGSAIGDAGKEALRERFKGDAHKLRILSGMTNAADIARERMPYPMRNGEFKLITDMTPIEAHHVACDIKLKVNPEVMCKEKHSSRKEAFKAVLTHFEYERRNGKRIGVYRGYIARSRHPIVLDADNVDSVRMLSGFSS